MTVSHQDGRLERHELEIEGRDYDVQRIDGLPGNKVEPGEAELVRIREDQAKINQARQDDRPLNGFAEYPVWPVIGPISGVFGSQRILNGKPRRPHRGLDVAVPTGSPVVSMASGIVAVAAVDMYFTGGTVIVDHGHGVQSLYAHLSELSVKAGQKVANGDRIGAVGATGRVTGPHLHWGVFWFDVAVDPALVVGAMPQP